MNVTLFGNWLFADITKWGYGHYGEPYQRVRASDSPTHKKGKIILCRHRQNFFFPLCLFYFYVFCMGYIFECVVHKCMQVHACTLAYRDPPTLTVVPFLITFHPMYWDRIPGLHELTSSTRLADQLATGIPSPSPKNWSYRWSPCLPSIWT